MKRFALTVLLVMVLAAPAMAGVGDMSIYADNQGNSCNLVYAGGAPGTAYMVQKFGPGDESTGVRLKVTVPVGVSMFFNTSYVPVGDIAIDLSIGYGVCINTTTVIGTFTLFSGSAPAPCSLMSVAIPDGFATALATDCGFVKFPLKVGSGIFNPDGTCQCDIATEPTSWGKVKALYR